MHNLRSYIEHKLMYILQTRQSEHLNTSLKSTEDYWRWLAHGASQTDWAFDPKYSIVALEQLFVLVDTIRTGCTHCSGSFYVFNQQMEGHSLQLELKCDCGTIQMWKGSAQYPDGSSQVNRDITRAWVTSGGQRGNYFKFCQAFKSGTYNKSSFDSTVKLLSPIILEMEDQQYRENIDLVNQTGKTIIGLDCQHARSQRASGPAPFATSTCICHNKGPSRGKILYQAHMSFQEMKEQGMSGRESKDKLTVDKGLTLLTSKLTDISTIICDGSSSANKSVRDIIIASERFHVGLNVANCFWHKAKTLVGDFNKNLLEKVKPLKEGKKKELMYPELKEMGATGKKVKNHWYRSQAVAKNDVDAMEDEFCSFIDHYIQKYPAEPESGWNGVSEATEEAVRDWCKEKCKELQKYVDGHLTDLEESFHRVVLKYWKKGCSYQYPEYIMRRALASLDWNENVGKLKENRTNEFQKDISDRFHKFLLTRRKGPNSEMTVYKPKNLTVTDYVI